MPVLLIAAYVVLGVIAGGFGTLVGAGGGFLLEPVLLLFFPNMAPETVTAITMTTVFFNSTSGSAAYARMKRIDYKTGVIFALAATPGNIIGTLLTGTVSRHFFDIVFGGFMVVFAAVILLKSRIGNRGADYGKPGAFRARRIFTGRDGQETAFSFNRPVR